MPKIEYVKRKFTPSVMALITKANEIIDEYTASGYSLTLRQLYYQFVARDVLPNCLRSYKNLGSAVNDGRLAGLIDWTALEDRTRFVRTLSHWTSPSSVIESAASGYRLNRWDGQDKYVEVWIEKDALVGVIEGVCNKWDVPFFSCRGYVSQSEMWEASKRFTRKSMEGRQTVLIHLGDHDPSGMDMTADIENRLGIFCNTHQVSAPSVIRAALTRDQIDRYGPPPNPAKMTDSRSDKYTDEHGSYSWELDSLSPEVLSGIVESHVVPLIDMRLFRIVEKNERSDKSVLSKASRNWQSVVEHLETLP